MPVGSNTPASPTVGSGEQRGITGYIIVASYYNSSSELCLPNDIFFQVFLHQSCYFLRISITLINIFVLFP